MLRMKTGLVNKAKLSILGMLVALPLLLLFASSDSALAVCPAAPASLPDTIERTDFCVYYDSNDTSVAQATTAADHTQDYWDRYVDDFGFLTPSFVDKLEVRLVDNAACNGGTWWEWNYLTINNGCVDEELQIVAGHELFHRSQYRYDGVAAKWFKEGTARAIEDNVFNNIDNWAGAPAATFSFNKEVNNYLVAPNNDITSIPMRYKSALWWKYFSEQYGSTPTEPELGVDAFLALWQAAATAQDVAALNQALAALGAGTNFNSAFRRFTVANWTKDLSGVPDASYNYIDEDQAGNPAPYGPLTPLDGGAIDSTTSATWNNQVIKKYGAKYFEAAPDANNCSVVTATFHNDGSGPAFYHVVTQHGTAFATHVEGSGTDWTQGFLNDGITKILAIAGSTSNSSQVDVTLSCADPVIDIKLPNNVAVAYAGPFDSPGTFLAQVLVTNGSPTGPVVGGLTNSDFKAEVNGIPAFVTGGGFIQENYWLLISAPVQGADGTYDLEVSLEEPGTTTVIASDTNVNSVLYDADETDYVVVIDRSGSMGANSKMQSAQDAANFFIDITRNSDGLSIVPFHHDVSPAPFPVQSVNLTVRNNAKTYINSTLPADGAPSGATSIGDGLNEAVNQRAGSPTGNPRCSFVLLSDGMENSFLLWNDVETDVVDTGCPVTSIAFGPASSETLMQDIAIATGGLSFYNDVFVSIPIAGAGASLGSASVDDMALDLGNTYEYAQAKAEGRQRLLAEKGVLPIKPVEQVHKLMVDETLTEVLFAVDWNQRGVEMLLRLRDPAGKIIDENVLPYSFADFRSGHLGWRIPKPEPGVWEMLVTHQGGAKLPVEYQVIASGHSNLIVELLLPDRLGRNFFTGNRVILYAIVAAEKPIPGVLVEAIVTAPDGAETIVPLLDDGQHQDGAANDGLYAGAYTRVNQAEAVDLADEKGEIIPVPQDEGAYRVRLLARSGKFQREALGAFAVLEGKDDNKNGMPDTFEREHGVSNPDADPDLDGLDNLSEYLSGTDPNNSDTDGGGENDGSEVLLHRQDPLNPKDDQIKPAEFFQAAPGNKFVTLAYDVKPGYVQMVLYRATSSTGPWVRRQQELPLIGIYDDPADNDQTFYYRLFGIDKGNHRSAVVDSEEVTPSLDPVPPEARVVVDDNAPTTADLNVALSFVPFDTEGTAGSESFDDIVEMKLSNDPFFPVAPWQPFTQDFPWDLDPDTEPGVFAKVHARFRDKAGNESVGTEVGTIRYEPSAFSSGDCNGDELRDAGDITAIVLEIFDGDGSNPVDTPGGTFSGNPACDSNEDSTVDAGDISCVILLIFLGPGACSSPGGPGEQALETGKIEPQETKGGFPPVDPPDRVPNPPTVPQPVPTGPTVGDMKPANIEIQVRDAQVGKIQQPQDEEAAAQLFFRDYLELNNSVSSTSLCCPEVSVAENGETIMMTGNRWMALSEDGGATFSNVNPTTIFPEVDGGFCCDQVIVYIPRIDMFVWLLQYWSDAEGKNRIRLAAQTTALVRSSNGTAWTYWDFISDVFNRSASFDYNDVSFGESSFWWTSQIGVGRVVVRIPLNEIAAKGTINFAYTGETDALWSHLTQNANDTIYWAGHVNNSELRVFSMRDGDGFYSWRSVTINSWPNGTNTSRCPDGSDWLPFESWKHYVFGNALQGSNVWFSWLASSGGGFPQPHVQMVRIDPSTWTLQEQVQIWNPTIAFMDAYLSTNALGELGMEIAFGSGGFYPSSAVGVWGDFVVYYPRLSTRCSSRWGDYNHSRRSGSNRNEWVAGGYTMETTTLGGNINRPHYIRYGR